MNLDSLYKKLALTSPYVEVMLRSLYWHNVKRLKKYSPNEHKLTDYKVPSFDFVKITEWLRDQGVKKGSLMVVHSSYDSISGCGLRPNEIVRELRELIGENGTLAMPVIRNYKEMPDPSEWLKTDFSKIVCRYDPKRTPVATGMIPSMLMREKDAVISLHPLNTMAAVGPLAEDMMKHNLDGDRPTPHGPNSSWKFCSDQNAYIVALGVNMAHHLTMGHVFEENCVDWPFKDWYHELQFDIVMPDKTIKRQVVRDRKPKWGFIHDAELNLEKELRKANVMKEAQIEGVEMGIMRASDLMNFFSNVRHKGFPYYKIL